jgi:hypothetical protein
MILPQKTRFYPWKPAAWLKVSGEDAPGFLQGQFTNDIRNMLPGNGLYGLWLNQKGKVLADSFVVPTAGERGFWVGSYFSTAVAIRERLEAYIVADDVSVEDESEGWMGVSLLGDGIGEWLAGEPREGVCFRGRRSSQESWEWVFPGSLWKTVRAGIEGAREVDTLELERLRVEALIPSIPADIGPGDLPNEGRLEADAISSTKGCYLGQEVMARIKSRGVVRRQLFRVAGPGAAPPVPTALWHAGALAGQLRSAVPNAGTEGFTGLAILQTRLPKPFPELALSAGARPAVRVLA